MPSPFSKSLRVASGAPGWLICIVAVVAVAATAIVAGHRHVAPEVAPVAASAEVTAGDSAAATHHIDRAPVVSRSATGRADRVAVARIVASQQLERKPTGARLPLAPSNAAETVASAKRSTGNEPGYCLEWTREQADIPSKYPDAATAWQHATGRRPGGANPPPGAVVYWTGGSSGYGHIAISVGHGKVRSSDAGGSGTVATVPIRFFDRVWHLQYAGWANSINGYTIPGVASAS